MDIIFEKSCSVDGVNVSDIDDEPMGISSDKLRTSAIGLPQLSEL